MTGVYKKLTQAHDESISAIAGSGKCGIFATGDLCGEIKIWNTDTLECTNKDKICHDFCSSTLEFGNENSIFLTTHTDTEAYLHSTNDGSLIRKFNSSKFEIWTGCFFPGDQNILAGSIDGDVSIWSVDTGNKKESSRLSDNSIMKVAVSPDGNYIAVATRKSMTYILDSSTLKPVRELLNHNGVVTSLAFSSDSKLLATSGGDTPTMDIIAKLSVHSSWVFDVKFSSNKKTFATCSCDNTVRIWSMDTRRCIQVFNEHTAPVKGICYNGDDTRLISAGFDGTICIYDL